MRILVAGATGVLGRQLVPLLVDAGHEVVGTTSRLDGLDVIGRSCAATVVMNGLDTAMVEEVVAHARPQVVVHEMTALGGSLDLRHFTRAFALTNRLRTEGTDNLLAASREVGVERVVAQSFAGWPIARTGSAIKTEDDPWDLDPVPAMASTLAALRHLEQAVLGIGWGDGVVLRYGGFTGPGTSLDEGGEQRKMIEKRRFPVVGRGEGMISLVDVRDAARATALAVEGCPPGVYHVVDDDPLPMREWLPAVAAALGAPAPRRVPGWVGRLLAGEAAAVMMTEARGADNAKAKRVLGWRPQHPTVPRIGVTS